MFFDHHRTLFFDRDRTIPETDIENWLPDVAYGDMLWIWLALKMDPYPLRDDRGIRVVIRDRRRQGNIENMSATLDVSVKGIEWSPESLWIYRCFQHAAQKPYDFMCFEHDA